jgi:GABA permease
MSKVLIVGNRSLGGDELRALVEGCVESGHTEMHLVVPVPSPFAAAVAVGATAPDIAPTLSRDVEEDRRVAQEQLEYGIAWLTELGVSAGGELSMEVDTPSAVARLVEALGANQVIVSTLPRKVSRWLRQDLPCRIGRKVSVPVTVVSNET